MYSIATPASVLYSYKAGVTLAKVQTDGAQAGGYSLRPTIV
jgi:hypothetical protein